MSTEFARIEKEDGLIVATMFDGVWRSGGYRAEVDQLIGSGKAGIVCLDTRLCQFDFDVGANMLVMEES